MAKRWVEYTKGKNEGEGKTKVNHSAIENSLAIVQAAKDDITAKDNAKLTRILEGKGKWATATTCAVFDLFADAGIPTAFLGRVSENEFAALRSIMVGFEVIARREVPKGSSYLNRSPQLAREDGKPHHFSNLIVEFCLKTTKGGYKTASGQSIVKGLDALDGQEDPIIKDPRAKSWKLLHSKKPVWEKELSLLRELDEEQVQLVLQDTLVKLVCTQEELINKIEFLTRWGYLLLEGSFKKLNGILQDIKFEFGICKINGVWTLVFADVIDCDSWRLSINGKQYSKQTFRDEGEAGLAECAKNYAYIADLVQQFGIPKQALVVWLGSDSDPKPESELIKLKRDLPTLDIIEVIGSLHKGPIKSLRKVQEITAKYPQGGVFAFIIGRSNAGGPMTSAHTEWPVMSCPASLKEFPDDLFSNVRMSSETPHLTVWPPENIIPAVLNQLSSSNPAAYALRRMRIEELDDPI